ncbi:cytochrome P450 [Hypoxylon fragiforme]|uniref:cytochrome P450 n=1 Tax=Hypoxylon fragiforme TaxID=63214 RepID=UPI0020C6E579|nr:cytochrome P450 [Hypoxylon fragiforme]KAI2608566.1 cytochrome P450 [Hypoxylon fragiforme]
MAAVAKHGIDLLEHSGIVATLYTMISFSTAIDAAILYSFALGIYRLYFHPLTKIPGPKLAALTGWYEAYFELFHKGLGGQYTFHIQELHKIYGPIVRINPHEVHIDDPNFYSTIYTNREGYDKPENLKWRFGSPAGLFSTPDHHLHKMRRAAQEPFFAKSRINKLSPEIQAKADLMCAKLSENYLNQDKPVTLDNLFASYIADVTTKYAFDRDFKYLSSPDFASPFVKAIRSFKDIAHPCTQFPWLARALAATPDFLVRILQPSMSCVLEFQDDMRRLIREAQGDLSNPDPRKPDQADKTIIHGILRAGLPQEELEMDVLKDHATSIIGAGIASAQWTLTIACFHVMSDQRIREALKKELESVMPDANSPLPYKEIAEKCPYLVACIEEAARLACGQMTRSPRISKTPITYGDYVLAPGTHISLDTWHMHHNETLYPQSYSYVPERWVGNPRAPAPYDSRPLKHYMVSFGRGTRHCIGMNLAYAEITIALASLIRRFDWELFETTDEDVKVVRDLVAPDVSRKSKGIRVLVKGT